MRFLLILVILCFSVSATCAQDNEKQPVQFEADKLIHDDSGQVITATGNVEFQQGQRIVKADQVVYDLKTDKVIAVGDVILMDTNGDVHMAESLELQRDLKNGFIAGLESVLLDGSRFWAEEGERINDDVIVLKDATYTPCEVCQTDVGDNKDPLWALSAGKVTHDKAAQRIKYKHATFDVYGVPVLYTPYFAHADGTVVQESGFLTPSFGFDSDLGVNIHNEYYWAMSPSMDATIGMIAATDVTPVATAEFRKRFENANIKFEGSLTQSDINDSVGINTVILEDEVRGHVFGEGLWNINQLWRAGFDIGYSSDDQYLKRYDFSSKDVLDNELYLERFEGRDYMAARLLAFQDLRVDETIDSDQPSLLPEFEASFIGDAGQTLGGQWSFDATSLNLLREGDGRDVGRVSADLGWYRRFVSDLGLVTTADLSTRGDFYHVYGIEGVDENVQETRFHPYAHVKTRYPVAKNTKNAQVLIEPIASVTFSPNIDQDAQEIPNEDSQEVLFDTGSLFSPNRFPGFDRIEDRSHAAYGLHMGYYNDDGLSGDVTFGQSYRFEKDDNPFGGGTGLSTQSSDYVGEVDLAFQNALSLNYRFILQTESLASNQHEVTARAAYDRYSFSSEYLYASPDGGNGFDESREQVKAGFGYYFNEAWQGRIFSQYDLGEDEGLRKASLGLDYFGDCINLSLDVARNLTNEESGEDSTDVTMRVSLKNLGDFKQSRLRKERLSRQ